jgi:hypothetical protein
MHRSGSGLFYFLRSGLVQHSATCRSRAERGLLLQAVDALGRPAGVRNTPDASLGTLSAAIRRPGACDERGLDGVRRRRR